MKTRTLLIGFIVAVLPGCAAVIFPDRASMRLYEEYSSGLQKRNGLDHIRASPIKAEIGLPFAEVWRALFVVLAQHATVRNISRHGEESGIVSFIEVDAVVHNKDPFLIDMPFTLLVERRSAQATMVYVQPETALIAKLTTGLYPVEQVESTHNAMTFKAQVFLDQVMNQAHQDQKWHWL